MGPGGDLRDLQNAHRINCMESTELSRWCSIHFWSFYPQLGTFVTSPFYTLYRPCSPRHGFIHGICSSPADSSAQGVAQIVQIVHFKVVSCFSNAQSYLVKVGKVMLFGTIYQYKHNKHNTHHKHHKHDNKKNMS